MPANLHLPVSFSNNQRTKVVENLMGNFSLKLSNLLLTVAVTSRRYPSLQTHDSLVQIAIKNQEDPSKCIQVNKEMQGDPGDLAVL